MVVRGRKASWRKMVFGLDSIFQVAGAARAKALWLVRGTPNQFHMVVAEGVEW